MDRRKRKLIKEGRCVICGELLTKQACIDHVTFVHIKGFPEIPSKKQRTQLNNNETNGITDSTEISAKRYEVHTPVVADLLNDPIISGKKRKFTILCEGLKQYYWRLFSIDTECSVKDLIDYVREWVDCRCGTHVETYSINPGGMHITKF